ncbi:MAG: alpha/beta hydrolase fold [Pseudonocardiales bacterium]|nr:alpha/beta hydrolase fold [Pseudonocardiales bacterium]
MTNFEPVDDYDEFGLLHDNAAELNLAVDPTLRLQRVSGSAGTGPPVSAVVWGEPRPPLVLLHGGGQNAHTWDSVLLGLRRPALAVDLPGHGRSEWRDDRDYAPATSARAVAAIVREHATTPAAVIGMSLGGLTAISLAAQFPDLVRALLLVDVTPESAARVARLSTEQKGAVALVSGPTSYSSFEEMADAAIAASPNRQPAAVRRGVRHNAKPDADGRWVWRYDSLKGSLSEPATLSSGWDEVSALEIPITLVRGGASGFVHDDDVTEMRRRQPGLRVHVVAGAGHAVQSDQPAELTRLISEFLADLD